MSESEFDLSIKYRAATDFSDLRIFQAWLDLPENNQKSTLKLVFDAINLPDSLRTAKMRPPDMVEPYVQFCEQHKNGRKDYHSWSNVGERRSTCVEYMKKVFGIFCLLQSKDQDLCFKTCLDTLISLKDVIDSDFVAFNGFVFLSNFINKQYLN